MALCAALLACEHSGTREAIQADYKTAVLTLTIPKRAEAKPKQIKSERGAQAAAAGARKQPQRS